MILKIGGNEQYTYTWDDVFKHYERKNDRVIHRVIFDDGCQVWWFHGNVMEVEKPTYQSLMYLIK